ncbi:MAG: ankyrin repeat domain-containing protein [Saprospiraceae bacterium]|nr:ankyrin repeat domain-containing protein [Saprospiraceae bacterium]
MKESALLIALFSCLLSFGQTDSVVISKPAHSTEVVEKEVYKYYKIPTSEVFTAVISADLEGLNKLKKGHINYYDYNADGETVLTLAVKLGNIEVIKSLEEQAVINMKNKGGESPLTLAIKSGNLEMIHVILSRAKAALRNDADETPIYLAMDLQNLDLVARLIDRGADVNLKSKGRTPLSRAVELNNLQMASLLIKNGADPSKPNSDGEIPLYIALSNSYKIMAGMLLGKSTKPMKDVNWKNKLGEPMIVLATKANNLSMVNQLIQFGTDVNAADYMDNTALIVAARNGHQDILLLLLEVEPDLDHQNVKGETAIIAAMLNNQKSTMDILAKSGANTTIMDYSGNSVKTRYPNKVMPDPNIQSEKLEKVGS